MALLYCNRQSSPFHGGGGSCVSLVESVSREIDEIRLSLSHQRTKETMRYSPVNNKKKSRAPVSGPQNLLFPSVSVNKCYRLIGLFQNFVSCKF